MKYDIIIVGAGPGGIFSAYELTKNRPDLTDKRLQLEHIMPQKLNEKWKARNPE